MRIISARVIRVGSHARVAKPRRRFTAKCLLCGNEGEANVLARVKCGTQVGPATPTVPSTILDEMVKADVKEYFE